MSNVMGFQFLKSSVSKSGAREKQGFELIEVMYLITRNFYEGLIQCFPPLSTELWLD